jgi:hypothetical protein
MAFAFLFAIAHVDALGQNRPVIEVTPMWQK